MTPFNPNPNNPLFQQFGGFQNFRNAVNSMFSERASYGYGVGGYFPLSYDGNSGARGRDGMGRFTSMDGRMMGGMSNDGRMMGGSSNGGYSGHSVRDRMIDRLERMRDEAQSESERREIQMEIDKMRMGG